MEQVNKLSVLHRDRKVGELTMTPDNKLCAFQYDKEWLLSGFSISPLELPLKPDLFIAKPEPFWGNWSLAPAYDLTRNTGGYNGEHATSVNNNGLPVFEDMLAVGESIPIPRKKGQAMIDSMLERCREILAKRFS